MTRIAAAVFVLALISGRADARTWTVGGAAADWPFIAPAIAAAVDGDTIVVAGGVYRENLVVDKRLTIAGLDRPTLIGTGDGSVITLVADGSEITGFAIEGSGMGETNKMDAAVQVRSSRNRVTDNVIRRVFYGIVVVDARHNEIADNEIAGLRERPYGQRGDGIYVFRSPENFIARNRISGERDAIYFQYAPRGRAVDNIVSDSRYGLHDMFSDEAVIARNAFTGSAVGANIMNSRRIRVERNRIAGNRGVPGIGLTLKDCDESLVRENRIVENARGLLLDGSSSNRFVDNAFEANDTAVTLFSSAERNRFGGNRFAANWSDVVLSGRDSATEWSIDGRGNSWSRYRGFDFDGDGLGDAPHPVVGAFERLEGANPGVRLFLQSPAAAGLELAARMSGPAASDGIDRAPLAGRATAGAPFQGRAAIVVIVLIVVWMLVGALRAPSSGVTRCSR
jgi:nitrous oxidase accessory protein